MHEVIPEAAHAEPIIDDDRFRTMLRRTTIALSVGLALPVLLLLALIMMLMRSAEWVDHTDRVIARVHRIQQGLVSTQSNFRGYRLSGEPAFLNRMEEERKDLGPALNDLGGLISDSAVQSPQIASLRSELTAWFSFLDEEVAATRDHPEQLKDASFLKRGVPLFDAVDARLDKIGREEQRLRGVRDSKLNLAVGTLFATLALAALAGIPTLVLWLQRVLRKATDAYRASLHQSELRARELGVTLQSIGDAVVATNARGEVDFLNPAAEALMGWSNGEAKGRALTDVFDIFNEQTGERTENPVERVLRENTVVGLANHTVLRARDGTEVPIEDSAAPIRGEQGEVIGVILVFHDVSDRRVVERRLLESESRLRFLHDLAESKRTLASPTEIMRVTTRLLASHLQVSRCAYAEVKADGEHFRILEDFTDGCASTVGDYQLSLFGPRAAANMRGGKTLVIREVEEELAEEDGAQMFKAIDVKAIVCCPLIKEGHLLAMMAVHQTSPRAWTPAEISLVEEVVGRCWATIERARAEAEVHERASLSILRANISVELDRRGTLDETLQGCCGLLVRHLEAAFARIWTLAPGEDVLVLRGSAGLYTHLDGPHARVPVGQFKIGRIAQNKQAHLTNDVAHDPNISDPEWAKEESMVAFAGYPLLVEGRVLGVLAVFARHAFSEAVLGDLSPISDAIAQHIERKRGEAALHASENLKTAILNTALDGFILMNHEGRIVDWNGAAEGIFHLERANAIGRLLSETIVPESLREPHRRGLARYVATREARILGRRYELPAIRSDGSEFPSEISITHIPGTEPPLFAGYVRDITERKANDAALHAATEQAEAAAHAVAQSAERFRLLSEAVSLQVWTARPDGDLDFANKNCVDYFGVAAESDVLGQAWATFVHPDDLPNAQAAWQHALETGARYEVEFRLRRHSGEYRWFLVRAEAMRDQEGRIATWFGSNTDIDDLKAAQREAERASRAKDNFLAVLSHELRTPLTPVLLTAAALRNDERLPTDVRSQLGMMERNISLEARLIDDMLDLTRIAKGKLPLRPQLCDAHSLIGLALEIVRGEAQTKGVELNQKLQAQHSGLIADPSRFQQVIWNLLRNAVKFTPAGGNVTIQTRDVAGDAGSQWLSIEIRDSGIGIEPAAIERIFQPFEQAGVSGDHRFGGVGLGLAIARAIVDLHGGTIRAESEGTGQGAIFVVELPGATNPPAGVTHSGAAENLLFEGGESAGTPNPLPPPSLFLLLVEDHEATLQVLTQLLTRAGHRVVSTSTVAAALQAASEQTFDAVISDLGLPDGTGNELMEQLREHYNLRGIALTGYGMEEDLERSRQAGFVAHLIKPVDYYQLHRTLAQFLPAGV